jgi:hypothetical protein
MNSGKSKLGWYAHRLWAMSPAEAIHRLRERWKHRGDGAFVQSLASVDPGSAVPLVPLLPLVNTVPWNVRVAIRTEAQDLMAGRWTLFGWRVAEVGSPPCWHRDASSGVIVEPEGWSHRLDHRDLPDGADVRTIWEINRWSQMTRLAMHGWIDRNTLAFETAQRWIEDWCERNPTGHGVNWTSALEVALRLINFTWFDALVEAYGNESLKQRQAELVQKVVTSHALWVARYRSFGSSANNHLLGELAGLLHAVKRWPALEAHVGTAVEIWDSIAECILQQFAEDGGNREQALHYHLFAWEMAWHSRRLMVVHREDVTSRLRAAAEYFVRMLHPVEGWDFGDSDDADVVPVTMSRRTAAAEWQQWMAGSDPGGALHFWMGASPLRLPGDDGECWWLAEQSGMAVGEAAGWMARLDGSPLGFGTLAAHGHCDALHVSLWDGAQAVVIDPGTGGYYGMNERRTQLAAWNAHNGPLPHSGYKSPERLGTFLWSAHHRTPEMRLVDKHTLSARLNHENRLTQRTVSCRTDGVIRIMDEVSGGDGFVTRWCLAPECRVEMLDATRVLIRRSGKRWMLQSIGEFAVQFSVEDMDVSSSYGSLEKSAVIVCAATTRCVLEWSRVH